MKPSFLLDSFVRGCAYGYDGPTSHIPRKNDYCCESSLWVDNSNESLCQITIFIEVIEIAD